MSSFTWPPQGSGGGGGVSSLNGLTGSVTLAAGSNITLTPVGNIITIASSGGGGGITSINTDTTPAQTLTTASTGTDFTITTTSGDSVFAIPTASASARGLLSSTDWSTFNGKQAAGSYITALTGDVTASGPGSSAATIANNAVTNAKAAQMATLTIKGNNTGGTANASDLSVAQVNAILPTFTSLLNGLVPASGGGTTTFLRADGTFAAPAGTGTVTSVSVVSTNGLAGTVATSTTTPAITLSTTITGLLKGNGTAISAAASSDLPTITLTGAVTGSASGGSIATTYAGVVPLLNGGTGTAAASANAAYNALSPMTTTGDIEYESATGIASRLAIGTAGQALSVLGSQTAPSWQTINQAAYANYLAANPGFEVDTTGYAAYANTAQATPVNGTGGSPTVTLTRSTSTPLFGTASGLFTHGASNQQGQGFSYDFTIDSAISTSATPCTITGYYSVASGTYDSGLIVWIYDKTNSVLIPCSAATINNVIGAFPIQCEFQPNTTSTSYRLIFHCSTTTATAYTVQFDQLSVSPNTYNPGAAVTDWSTQYSFTPNGYGTVGASYYSTRRVGSELQVRGYFTAGTIAASTASLSMPAGLSIDSTKLGTLSNGTFLGVAIQQQSSLSAAYGTGVGEVIFYDGSDTTKVYIGYQSNSGFVKVNGSSAGVTGQALSFAFSVPIAGWGVTQNLSSDTDTRVIAASIGLTTNVTPTVNTALKYDTVLFDTAGAYNTSTGLYTAPVPGKYNVGVVLSANGVTNLYVVVTGVSKTYIAAITASGVIGGGSQTVDCKAGDTIGIFNDTSRTFTGAALFVNAVSFVRVSGPAQIAASESVNMRAFSSTTTISGSLATVVYATKGFDSHNAYNATTGIYTVPAPGKYQVNSGIATAGTIALNNALDLQIQQTGSASQISESLVDAAGAVSNLGTSVSDIFNCLAGDTLKVQVSSGATLPTVVSSNSKNFLSVTRVGN